jgi:hypothetical protein
MQMMKWKIQRDGGGFKMETTRKSFKSGLVIILVAFIMMTVVPGFKTEARAGGGAAFLGGMVAGHIVGGFVRRDRIKTAAAVESVSQPRTQTVYVQQQPTQQAPVQAQPAQAAKPSVEQRLKELDKLAKDGYITPEEYKARKKAIIDSL